MSSFRAPFEPLTPGGVHVTNTNSYRHPLAKDEHAFMTLTTDAIEEAILFEGPETIAAVMLEPVQNAGGCLTAPAGYFQRVREICDKYGVLLISDEVICSPGRLGTMFGAERYGYQPDMITMAKGLTSGYSPLGAVICSDFARRAVPRHAALGDTERVPPRLHLRRASRELRGRGGEPAHLRGRSPARATSRVTKPASRSA